MRDIRSFKKCDDVKTVSLCNKRNQTNANAQKLKKAQSEQTYSYLKEQIEYIQDQINKIKSKKKHRQNETKSY